MDTVGSTYTVEKDETRLSADKRVSIEFRAGQRIPLSEAVRFGFVEGASPYAGARPGDEIPDVSPTELEKRGLPAAPENRMEPNPAPENRELVAEADYPVWYREHAAKAPEGTTVVPLYQGETKTAYLERTGAAS